MNTKILLRTLTEPHELQKELGAYNLEYQLEGDTLKVSVLHTDIETFQKIITKYLSAPYNYVNIKFPDKKSNVLIFPNRTFLIFDEETDRAVKEWALSIGLSKPETEWTTFYDKSL
ncbi:MAG: hypothetical protein A3G52_05045 [Candidatus Taylorbacteria bacterium RIFCSPLOWO2_12_FULL_43_20]|uniref:Uncharacterized protein n=1 Tax=Candidatus Taylorbacteria bacterium RIFCSPLOWO2_12_FULL_43_20 TaxID=1802332 RepID=A0A1G2NZ67_9BACT|nr:MAG: hypothetical protein A2825_03510 [Candidatus Taylorbacteria bacterium RIFCSPHIGHO2_01_FULL_43_120]OHA23781.1 MAG: hypothetical protein A3B98_03040 [Candidatus Taylorbacteria bacterium RIFCSPHIGHO2_02_FULL_43_55]OHA30236.1 MAG: hypothetical protein A3E92_01435 [Candidatus Taylorbacteria bacterium RIFCSPHIGHO2_12_FULL_42_34]OHA31985.1 MAG: hypothetical protein A3B09_01195 [Candidatus Taylorbacteria bacterium RIFCSPLOWO2_01_FULL_43_83]OHA38008.1 MAG: hypothetical protein A3H58_01610 [Candi